MTTVLIGGHRCVNEKNLNSFICLRGGKITYCYDKQHLIPFIEMIPKVCQMLGCGEFFISAESACSYPNDGMDTGDIDTIEICGQIYQVFICSELFFEAKSIKG